MLEDATKERIEKDIASEDVVLYMKGTPAVSYTHLTLPTTLVV